MVQGRFDTPERQGLTSHGTPAAVVPREEAEQAVHRREIGPAHKSRRSAGGGLQAAPDPPRHKMASAVFPKADKSPVSRIAEAEWNQIFSMLCS